MKAYFQSLIKRLRLWNNPWNLFFSPSLNAERAGELLVNKLNEQLTEQLCSKCGQADIGQTGEYPCSACGLPLVYDDPE